MKKSRKSRKAKVVYVLQDAYGKDVNIDLNNYKVICTKTGKRKSFYHKYLFNLISRKYEGNIDRFRTEYVSREAAPNKQQRRKQQLENRINKLRAQLQELVAEKHSLETPQLTNN